MIRYLNIGIVNKVIFYCLIFKNHVFMRNFISAFYENILHVDEYDELTTVS